MSALDRAWLGLILLSVVSTAVALSPLTAPWSGVIILISAWAKARIIFLWYLDLASVPGWRGGVQFGLALFALVLLALYLIA